MCCEGEGREGWVSFALKHGIIKNMGNSFTPAMWNISMVLISRTWAESVVQICCHTVLILKNELGNIFVKGLVVGVFLGREWSQSFVCGF